MAKNIKLLVTGGHLTPALAMIDWLDSHQPKVEIHFVGRLYSQTGKKQLSRERLEIKNRQLAFYPLDPPKFATGEWWQKILFLPLFLLSLIKAWQIISHAKPDLILMFGGYLAVPVALVARMKQIPSITHEQTPVLGLANRVLAKLVNFVAVAYEDTLAELPTNIGVLTGNPVRQAVLQPQLPPVWFEPQALPLLYITGGRLGSEIINQTVGNLLPQLLKNYQLIHQTGPATTQRNYQAELESQINQQPDKLKARYITREWLEPEELAWVYRNCLAVIGRSGANTVSELLATATPSLLIPLPFAYRNEQMLNAKMLVERGGALLLEQKNLTPDSLLTQIELVAKKAPIMRKQLAQQFQNQAQVKIWELISRLITTDAV